MEKTYEVKGMSCVICKSNVEKTLNGINGVNSAIVSLMDNEVLIDFDQSTVSEDTFHNELIKQGYDLILNKKHQTNYELIKVIISSILMIILMIISMFYKQYVYKTMYIQLLLALTIIIININYYKSGFNSIIKLAPNMDSLISISSVVSLIYSIYAMINISTSNYHLYFETSAMVLVVSSIGKYIENINKKKTTKFIRGLSTLIPMQANLIINDETVITPIEQIKKNDILLIKPGESIPQDGTVIKGESNVDESLITGESLPQYKTIDSNVIGGTINIDGVLTIRVNKNANQTAMSKIVSLTKQASMTKIPIERFADKIASYFVYGVFIISLVSFLVWMIISKDIELALNFSLSVLVISCPCALGLATPSCIAVACNALAKNSILIKNPEIIEIAHKIKSIVLDKTGTLSYNKLSIVNVEEKDASLYKVIRSLENNSNHPIANSIKQTYSTEIMSFDKIVQTSAEGIVGYIGNDEYYAGNKTLLMKHNINIDKQIEYANNNGYSYIGVGKNAQLLGVIYLADNIKKSSYKAISNLHKRNINVIMATGDNDIIASKIAKDLDIDKYYANVNPQDKQDIVNNQKQSGIVAMVGDGINDAVALSSADIAISLNSGTDIAINAGDITLLDDNIDGINYFIDLSKKTMRIIKQNLFWALFYNSLFIPLAAGCFYYPFGLKLNPMIGAISMSISSIIVISNALRIKNVKKGE